MQPADGEPVAAGHQDDSQQLSALLRNACATWCKGQLPGQSTTPSRCESSADVVTVLAVLTQQALHHFYHHGKNDKKPAARQQPEVMSTFTAVGMLLRRRGALLAYLVSWRQQQT